MENNENKFSDEDIDKALEKQYGIDAANREYASDASTEDNRTSFEIEKDGATYILVVRGCGNKTVKLECYIPYLQILKGKDDREIEKEIFKLINTVY